MTTRYKLTKRDALGYHRLYWGEIHGDEYRTWSQRTKRDKPVPSSWTTPRKNNMRTPHQQCQFEMDAIYAKRERLGWRKYAPKKPRREQAESTFYSPMLAQKYPHLQPPASGFYAQPKLDGVRCTGSREGLVSRKNVVLTSVPHVQREVAAVLQRFPEIYTLDGELYLHGLSLHDISGRVRRHKPDHESHELLYHVFDIETQWGSDPFHQRWQRLTSRASWIKEHCEYIRLVQTEWCDDITDADWLHKRWLKAGYEGSMYRDPAGPYVHKRSKFLLKRKDFIEKEFRIVNIREGNGAWRGCAKAIDYVDKRGEAFDSGIRGTQAYLRTVLRDKHKLIGKLGTVRYFNLTPDRGVPYLPVTVNLGRWDLE